MDFLKYLENNSILIIPSNIKTKVLDYIDENDLLLNIKIMSFDDLKKGLLYNYDEKSIHNVMKKYNISYSITKEYLNNTYYILEDSYESDKLNKLLDIKKYLIDSDLLIKDGLFIHLLKSKNKMYVYGFDYINKFNEYLLNLASKYIRIEKIEKEENEYEHDFYEAKNIEEEVLFVASKIEDLIDSGVSLNKTYITGVDENYNFTLRRIFNSLNIPYYSKNTSSLYDTSMVKYFFDLNLSNIEDALDIIKEKYDVENNTNTNSIYNQLINLINKYYFTDNYEEVKMMMIEDSKTINLPSIHMTNEILNTNLLDNVFLEDEYVFLMNFNMGVFPSIKKDEDYINDSIKPSILETSKEFNKISKEIVTKAIKNIKNLTISYKLSTLTSDCYKSILVDNSKIKKIDINYSEYDDNINKLILANHIDELIKFNVQNANLPILNNTYSIEYKDYNNEYSGIKSNILPNVFSYSSISKYYKCPFNYYCSFILNLDEFKKTRDTFIGSAFHYVLEVCLKNDSLNVDDIYDEYYEKNKDELDNSACDLFFINKVKEELKVIVNIIKEQYKSISVDFKELPELKVEKSTHELGMNTKVNAIIKGFVDKCIVIDNDCMIIDYKTGSSDKIRRDLFEYGIDIQLPIYMYLLEVDNSLNVAGIYLQHILSGNNKKTKKTLEETKMDELKLDGLTSNDKVITSKFFDEKDRKNSLKRYYSLEEKNDLKEIVKKIIENCVNDVYDAKFDISPINIPGKVNGCDYCKFRDVCFRTNSQIRYIDQNKEGDISE
ncbi:MAG: hypothetical protein E7158_00225 [Firmicutes bacterium]|nr:hypothetical protein [Bacillota bacterium]